MVCTAIPALVTLINGSQALAKVGSQPCQINVFLTPEVDVGDYVLLRNGCATTVISKQEAHEIFELLEEIAKVDSD